MNDAEPIPARDVRSHRSRRPGLLATLVLVQVGVFVVFTSWAFGGQVPWARQVIAGWGAVGVVLFVAAVCVRPRPAGEHVTAAIRCLWPLLLFDVLVGLSCFNPSFNEVLIGGEPSLVMGEPLRWLPSSARPLLAAHELWQFNVFVLSCFNLCLALPTRRLVRTVLFILGGNAVALAVFGTFQKLGGADGLWFGLVPSTNPKFFSTFVYPNHWGAFTLLNTAVCLGLLQHFLRRRGDRDLWHTPVPLAVLATLLLAATIPLSASRSSTVLLAVLLLGFLAHLIGWVRRHRRETHRSAAGPVAAILLAAGLAVAAIGFLGREVIVQRTRLTAEQVTQIAREETLNSRLTLYRDTWRMAAARPWCGWGLESYAHVFRIFNTQRAAESWVWIPFYARAHNDWFQSLAEVGFAGTGLRALLVLAALRTVPWRRVDSLLPRYLLGGCGLVLLYAWVEFPFANPAVMLTFCATFCCALRYAALDPRDPPAKPPAHA